MQQKQPESAQISSESSGQAQGLTLLRQERPSYRWYHKLTAVMAALFCFELGVFLLIYPWVSDWTLNASVIPLWGRAIWTSSPFRGAISGVGILNIYISFTEVARLRRFS